jgi:hypothetical protein
MAKSEPMSAAEEHDRDTPLPKSNDRPRGRPTPEQRAREAEDSHNFFQTINKVHQDEWGSRYNLYVYRVEPVIDKTRSGEPKYVMCYAEPINEDRILAEHGSGRYKLILNFRKAGNDRGQEVDKGYISLLNMSFPPRIAPGEWVDDPRNKAWAWAKKHFPPDNEPGTSTDPLKTLELFNKIRRDTAEELKPGESPENRMLTLATVLEKLSPKPHNPDETMKNMASVLAQLRPPEDKLSTFLLEQHTVLMKEFLKAKEAAPERPNAVTVIKELVSGARELIPQFRELVPGIVGGDGAVSRSRLNGWQELTVALAPHVGPVLSLLVGKMLAPGQPGAPPALPAAPGQPVNGTAMMPFLQMIANPMVNYAREMAPPDNFDPSQTGQDFASWVFEGFGSNPHYAEAIAAARLMGPVGLIAAFRNTPFWNDRGPTNQAPSLAMLEAQLTPFFSSFLSWVPATEEEEEDSDAPLVLQTASETSPPRAA